MSQSLQSKESNEESWMSIADLMAGLMVVFVFIAIAFIRGVGQEQARLAQSICEDIKTNLAHVSWRKQVEICDEEIVVKFKDPSALFNWGKHDLKPQFRVMLSEFFPEYMSTVHKYKDEIEEVRIEGHTDDTGPAGTKLDKYFYNIGLSQRRTRSVMLFLFETPTATRHEGWLIRHMTANGLSSSNPVLEEDATIMDRQKSRRVEFKIRLKTPKRIREIAKDFL